MTIRGGGRPRDPRAPVPYDEEHYAYEPWSADPRQTVGANGRSSGGGGLGGFVRFLVFALVLGGIVLGVLFTVLRPLATEAVVGWAYDSPSALRIPFVQDLVRERLGAALTEPPGDDASEVRFIVRQGDTVPEVATRLAEQGLIRDPRAFVFQATVDNLAPKLQAGNFRLARNMTPAEIVTGLVENRIVIVIIPKTFRESLRIDQMATLIQTWTEEELSIDAEEFREIATNPSPDLLEDYPWLQAGGLPEDAPLEGYLFPARYDLRPSTTADDLVRMMLDRFVGEVGVERAGDPTFYERLVLASIVEREARLEEERPLIAGVYQNRLNGSGAQQILNADPTVFYALDTVRLREIPFEEWAEFLFWKPPGEPLAEVELPPELEGYNTYRNRGLPPTPICSPGITSIEAAMDPDTDAGYLYFVAIPDADGAHDFSKTLEEHNQKLREYGYR